MTPSRCLLHWRCSPRPHPPPPRHCRRPSTPVIEPRVRVAPLCLERRHRARYRSAECLRTRRRTIFVLQLRGADGEPQASCASRGGARRQDHHARCRDPAPDRAVFVHEVPVPARAARRTPARSRQATPRGDRAHGPRVRHDQNQPQRTSNGRAWKDGWSTVLALLLVWAALVAPNQTSQLDTSQRSCGFPRAPCVVVALAVLLPATRAMLVVGALLSVLVLVKVLDIGPFTAFDRPFKPVDIGDYVGIAVETLRRDRQQVERETLVASPSRSCSSSRSLALLVLALLRVTRVAAGHRGWATGRRRRWAWSGWRSASSARRSPPRAPPPWPSTRCRRCGPASRIARRSPASSPMTASAPLPATGC